MVNNVNANTVMQSPFANNARVLGNRPARLNLPTNFSTPNIRNGVEVNISEQAQRLFAQMQEGNGDLTTRLSEFVEKEAASLTPMSFHEHMADLRQAHSSEAWEFLRQAHFATGQSIIGTPEMREAHDTSSSDFFSLENAEMAEMGFQLLSVVNFDRSDIDNFAALGNRYAEMRNALEATYSGDELEAQLNNLSEAFDLTVEILAHDRALSAWLRMRFESARIDAHNQMLNQNTTQRFFDADRIEYDEEELNRIFSRVTNGIKESTRHFAQLTRQFVLDNGTITERNREALLALLRDAEAPQAGFSFDNLNSINEILRRPLGNGDIMRHPEQHPETIFSELERIL